MLVSLELFEILISGRIFSFSFLLMILLLLLILFLSNDSKVLFLTIFSIFSLFFFSDKVLHKFL